MQKFGKTGARVFTALAVLAMSGASLNVAAQPLKKEMAPAASAAQADAANAGDLRLRWELLRYVFPPDAPYGRAQVRLELRNQGAASLPAQGWSLYFTSIEGLRGGVLAGDMQLEQVSGTLFRVRPLPGFKALAPGQSVDILMQTSIMVRQSKAPTGPYLVYDSSPETGVAIADYQLLPSVRPEQLDKGAFDRSPVITAQDVYRANEVIVDIAPAALPAIFPTPQKVEQGTGTLHLSAMPEIIAAPALRNEAALAQAILGPFLNQGRGAPPLRLTAKPIAGQSSPEAYELTVDAASGIAITGNSAAGVSRGLQSLRDLLPLQPSGGKSVDLAALRVVDAPRFDYRGFQLDVARNFQDKQTVFRLLDLMARYKLNSFHFHLTDDEGWRLEIKGLPELTTIGAVRGHTLTSLRHLQPAYGSGPDTNDPHGSGFYTRRDYIEIVKYAAARHIDVIPEIEMPGHARAAVKAMESRYRALTQAGRKDAAQYLLNDLDDKSQYSSAQRYTDHVINPGLESTYTFLAHVIGQVTAMHKEAGAPLRTIHVGGDELPRGAWEKSPASLALMKKNNLATTAELWDYFFDRVDRIVRKNGLTASGWEELGARITSLRGKSKLIPNPVFTQRGFTVYVWNNTVGAEDLAYRLANAGYATVLAPVTNLYFDMAHNKNPDEPGVNWGAYVDLDTVFDFIPFDYLKNVAAPPPGKDGLTAYGQEHIRGLEATLFSETIRDPKRLDYMIMPRMLGLAERAWAQDPDWAREQDKAKSKTLHDGAWSVFVNTLGKRVLPRLAVDSPGLAYRIAPPGLLQVDGHVLVNHQLPGLMLRYTVDGSDPDAGSAAVAGAINAKSLIRVAAFDRNGRRGIVSQLDNR